MRRALLCLPYLGYLMVFQWAQEYGWPPVQLFPTAGVIAVHVNQMARFRVGRIAWSMFRHPVKSREFPAKHERLVTADELMRYGV